MNISLSVNGEMIEADVLARTNLIDFLRDDIGLTGSHVGCEQGVCGACTMEVDGAMVRGCLMLAVQADGSTVTTIEGLGQSGRAQALQDAFHKHNALQCGYCTAGMMATAVAYIESGGSPDRTNIRKHLSGNYCRCTGYQAIVDAISEVASSLQKSGNANSTKLNPTELNPTELNPTGLNPTGLNSGGGNA